MKRRRILILKRRNLTITKTIIRAMATKLEQTVQQVRHPFLVEWPFLVLT